MSKLESDLIRLLDKLSRERATRETRLARSLLQIYEEARKELYLKFLEAQGGKDTLKLQYLEGTIRNIETQMKYYTNLTAKARQGAIDEAFLIGQDVGYQMLSAGAVAGGYNVSLIAGVGMINRGMVEALIGDVPKLAGRVESHILFRIRDELTKGAVMGEGIPKLARRILGTGLTQDGMKKPFPSIKKRCEVIARTEIIKASDAGYEDLAAKAQEVIGEEIYDAWLTAGDDRVDAECRAIASGSDGRFNSIPGHPGVYRRDGGPRPVISTHPRCRCRRVPYLLSWAESGALNLNELKGHRPGDNKPSIGKTGKEGYTDVNNKRTPALNKVIDVKEREIAGLNTEKGYLFDPHGNVLLSKVGDRSSIGFTETELALFSNNVFTHNHPRDSSFSHQDIGLAATWNLSEIRAVGVENRHSMRRPVEGWSLDYWENTIQPAVDRHNNEIRAEFTQKIRSGEMTVDKANKLHWHEVWTRVARELGLDYTKESW